MKMTKVFIILVKRYIDSIINKLLEEEDLIDDFNRNYSKYMKGYRKLNM